MAFAHHGLLVSVVHSELLVFGKQLFDCRW
jgi:hypothetical protein